MSSDPRPVFAPARVVSTSPATDRIQRITLQRPPSRKAAPGTHVDVRVRTPKGEDVRSYSVVESNADGSLLTVSVMRAQASRGGSVFMHGLVEGDELACTQPLQNFELRPGAHRYVLLAGGVGITAVIEMGRVLHRLGQDYRFVYVGRSRAQMAYLDELAALHGDRLEVHADDEGSALDVEALVAGLPEQGRTEVYMCGPIRLMDAVRRSWLAHGRPVADLRYETFGSSGWFEPEAFEVEIPELGLRTVVEPDSSLLESLAAAGADMMYDCRKGECGLCEVRIGALQGRVDHRDVFLSDDEKSTDATLCICVSRVAGPADGGTGRLTLTL
ncbi:MULTISPECIES: PDR/VanB family oxidoreductase [unclassified Aeromicrobium]|uniref:PDR/VanB family oxidoreductase n=1 Tax=unclassified Aeromicrobium TaxID=2633570 RepID=UPI002889FE84|nr:MULTISPECIES: PDR/VanB family oxidoreductase [unclassified Aeromicrobium]